MHWLWVALPSACDTRATLPGRYWASRAALISSQAFGTDRNSPRWNVVTRGAPAATACLLWNGHVLVTHSAAAVIAATATTAPVTVRSLRRDFLARAAAWRPRRASARSSRGQSWSRGQSSPSRGHSSSPRGQSWPPSGQGVRGCDPALAVIRVARRPDLLAAGPGGVDAEPGPRRKILVEAVIKGIQLLPPLGARPAVTPGPAALARLVRLPVPAARRQPRGPAGRISLSHGAPPGR